MKLVGKKLLILAGASVHVKLVEAARDLGIYTIVADYLQPSDSPAKQIADEHLEVNIMDVDRLVEYGRKNEIDGVIGFCVDPTQRPAQAIAEKLGLPTFGTRDQVLALTDKTIFKKLCVDCGVDIIPSYTEDDIERGTVDYPVLVKPVDSRGSRGACVCANREELLGALPNAKKESSNGGCIIEKHMSPDVAQDLTISYLVKDGVPELVSVGDRHSGRVKDNLDRQLICTIQPSRFAFDFLRLADGRVKKMIQHLGIKNGPVFFQGFWDGDTVRLYDPGLRFPGNEYERLLRSATGVDLMKILCAYCVTGKLDWMGYDVKGCWNLNGKTCLQYMVNAGAGRITTFDGLNRIAQHPNVVDVRQKHYVGDLIEPTGDVRHRSGEISILCERNSKAMKEMLDFVHNELVLRNDQGFDQIISPFLPESIDRWYSAYV